MTPDEQRIANRRYGDLVAAIRQVAACGKPFTRLDVHGPFARVSVANMLYQLYRRGELKRVTKPVSGWNSPPPKYRKAQK